MKKQIDLQCYHCRGFDKISLYHGCIRKVTNEQFKREFGNCSKFEDIEDAANRYYSIIKQSEKLPKKWFKASKNSKKAG